MNLSITQIKHPFYIKMSENWRKFRLTFEGGDEFKREYLYRSDRRESIIDYNDRIKISYCSALAKSAVIDIKNSIQHRLSDVKRYGGVASFQEAINGKNGGVDLRGNSMNNFIGKQIIQELINMQRIGIFVDKPRIEKAITVADEYNIKPYLYTYKAEDILSWTYDYNNRLTALLLRNYDNEIDPFTGLTKGIIVSYKLLQLVNDYVICTNYNKDGEIIGVPTTIDINRIPFILLELSQSLLVDIADHQIALTNLASADMVYAFRANFPFYTEQYDPLSEYANRDAVYQDSNLYDEVESDASDLDGTQEQADVARDKTIELGPVKGRKYPKGFERPGFISPPPEPLRVSMEKQEQLAKEIRIIVNLSLSNLVPQRASEESKKHDDQGLESGLSVIGSELEYAENQIAEIWSLYEGKKNDAVIKYPTKYGLKTDSEKRKEAKELKEFSDLASKTYQKELAKRIVDATVGGSTSSETLKSIYEEIDDVELVFINSGDIIKQTEAGLMGNEFASELLGIPSGQVEKAKKDHEERLKRIVISQQEGGGVAKLQNPEDRGVKDLEDE